jgi:hypothetical protein
VGRTSEQRLLAGAHAVSVAATLVVVAEEMEDAVHQEVGQLLLDGMAGLPGLALGGLERNDDLAKERIPSGPAFGLQAKREDVRGLIDASEAAVQLTDGRIAGHDDAETVAVDVSESGPGEGDEGSLTDLACEARLDVQRDGRET